MQATGAINFSMYCLCLKQVQPIGLLVYSIVRLIRTRNTRKFSEHPNYLSLLLPQLYQRWRVVYRTIVRIIQKVGISKGQIIRGYTVFSVHACILKSLNVESVNYIQGLPM